MSHSEQSEIWQVELGGDVRAVSFDEVCSRIADGTLLRIDRVKKGDLRWIEAGKVPALHGFFNAKDLSEAREPVVNVSSGSNHVEVLGTRSTAPESQKAALGTAPDISSGRCSVHADVPAAFVCETCLNEFCKACPNSYGGTVKICPFCGAMCKSVAAAEKAKVEEQVWQRASTEKFGFGDFFESLAYPFRYPVSLVLGALMFAFFSLGQGAASFGGMFMISASIMCFMCANMLSFGVLANIVENFSQGKTAVNFMPSFDDFNLWDDVIHPFFLMIGAYISSFGPLIAVFIVSIFLFAGAVKPTSDEANAVNQGQKLKQMIAQQNEQQKQRIEQMTDASKLAESESTDPTRRNAGTLPALPSADTQAGSLRSDAVPSGEDEEKHFQDLNNQIQQARKQELESTFGKTPETQASEQKAMVSRVLGYGALFLIFAGLALLWGLFYFPAACCVAGYTRSFGATVNPTVGLDTIKRLGGDYAKVLLMGLAIAVMSGMVSFILAVVFNVFALPGVGNLPAKFIGSIFGFYLSVVFSCVLGFAIYKASDRLQLFKG